MPKGYDIESVRRAWVGRESERRPGRYPVEHEPIRRYCHMVDDTNPLYLDPEHAKAQGYRDSLCPAMLVRNFALPGPWPPTEAGEMTLRPPTPGDRAINMGNEVEYLKPVCVGDRLWSRSRIADVFMKAIRLDPEAVWTVTELVISNQDGDDVLVERSTLLNHRTPEQVAASKEA